MKMNAENSSNSGDVEMVDLVDQPSFQEEQQDVLMGTRSVSSRGAKKIPNQWTRIISMNDDQDEQIPTYSIAVDLQLAGLDNLVAQAGTQKTW